MKKKGEHDVFSQGQGEQHDVFSQGEHVFEAPDEATQQQQERFLQEQQQQFIQDPTFANDTFGNEIPEETRSSPQPNDPYRAIGQLDETPAPIVEWKEKQRAYLEEKDATAAAKAREISEEAKKAVEEFFRDFESKKASAKKSNRIEQEKVVASLNAERTGNPWGHAVDLCGLEKKGQKSVRDTSRMKR